MTFSSAHAALATNIAPTAKQTILGALILILFRLAAARRNIYSAPTDAEGAHRLCIGCGDLRELGVLGEQVIPAREMFVHNLGGSGPDSVGVLRICNAT